MFVNHNSLQDVQNFMSEKLNVMSAKFNDITVTQETNLATVAYLFRNTEARELLLFEVQCSKLDGLSHILDVVQHIRSGQFLQGNRGKTFSAGTAFMLMQTGWIQASR